MTVVQLMTGSPNYPYNTDGAMAYVESGALLTKVTNATINVDVTVGDYVSIVGSPNYALPAIGSVEVSSIRNALPAGTALLGSVIASPVGYQSIIGSPAYNLPIIGSVEISNSTLNVDVTVSDYVSVVGSPNYSLPVIGSIQVSSIVGALPAGTALLGSVVADIVGLNTSDYISVVGSPNYSIPVIGSVQISGFDNGSVTAITEKVSNFADGSVWITSSVINIMQPRANRASFEIVAGSQASNNTSGKIWAGFDSSRIPGRGIELVLNQVWGRENWDGSVAAITDAGSILVGYNEIFR